MYLIKVPSESLGDLISTLHVIEKFRELKTPNEKIGIIANKTEHYIKSYPMFKFYPLELEPTLVYNPLGWILEGQFYDKFKRLKYFLHENLMESIARQLEVPDSDVIYNFPKIDYRDTTIQKEKLITFSMHGTAQVKHWNYPNGWEILIDKLKDIGYKVVNVDFHESFGAPGYFNPVPDNCVKMNGLNLKETSDIINRSEFFIGISSGLSWLAHSLKIPVVMISGMTRLDYEFKKSILRIGSQAECRNCFSNPKNTFDPNDWLWCPEHKGTEREFECSKSITPDHVFENIQKWLELDKPEIFI